MGDLHLVNRPESDQRAIGAALRRHGSVLGSFVEVPDQPLQPWTSARSADEASLRRGLHRAQAAGRRAGGGYLIVTARRDDVTIIDEQMNTFAAHLNGWAPDAADAAGMRLCVEAISPQRLPGSLLTSTAQPAALAARVSAAGVSASCSTWCT